MKTFIFLALSILFLIPNASANNLVSKIVLYYETDAFVLTIEQQEHIENKLESLSSDKIQYFVEIDGHTDNEGNLSYNQKLSDNRANEIRDFFVHKTFVKQQVFTAGHSYKQPLVDNVDEDNKQLNRRVEVNIYNGNVSIGALGSHQLQEEIMTIDNQVDNLVEFESGIKFKIAANSFVNQNGEAIVGDVTLHHVPYNDYKDFILSDIPMSSLNENQDYFSSAGMFELTASSNEAELQLAENTSIDVEMPATSLEIETELFEFDAATNQWNSVKANMKKEQVAKVSYDTIDQNMYQTKRECLGYGFKFYNVRDTVFFDNALTYLKNTPFTNELVLDEAKGRIELQQLDKVKKKWQKKQVYFNSSPALKIDTLKDEEYKIQFSTRISKNLSASELKYFNAIKTFITQDQLTKLTALDDLNDLNIESIRKDKLFLKIVDVNNNTIEVTLSSKPKGSKSRYKKTLKSMEDNFAKVKEERLNSLQLATEKIEITINKITELEAVQLAVSESFSNGEIYHKELLDSVYFYLSRYHLTNQTRESYYNEEVLEVDVDKWIVSNATEKNDILLQLETIRRGLYCSSSANSTEITGTYKKVIESKKRKFENATDDLMYSFSMNSLGVMNADRLMKQPNALAVTPKEYVNEKNEVVMICRLFLVGASFNGVIKYDGSYGYSPYKFLIDNNKSYGLVAVDVKGNTYKMDKNDFDKTVTQISKGGIFNMTLIEETDNLELFASN